MYGANGIINFLGALGLRAFSFYFISGPRILPLAACVVLQGFPALSVALSYLQLVPATSLWGRLAPHLLSAPDISFNEENKQQQ